MPGQGAAQQHRKPGGPTGRREGPFLVEVVARVCRARGRVLATKGGRLVSCRR